MKLGRQFGHPYHCPRCGHRALSEGEIRVLVALFTAPSPPMIQELARITDMAPGNAKRVVGRLIGLGMAREIPDIYAGPSHYAVTETGQMALVHSEQGRAAE
jgi:DNA-binding MarR family transcriptional regulator